MFLQCEGRGQNFLKLNLNPPEMEKAGEKEDLTSLSFVPLKYKIWWQFKSLKY